MKKKRKKLPRIHEPSKAIYRDRVYARVSAMLSEPIINLRVLYMESGRALETLWLLKNYHPHADQLHPSTWGDASHANITRRVLAYHVDTSGHIGRGILYVARQIVAQERQVDVIHFDFFGHVDTMTVHRTLQTGVLVEDGVVIINVVHGRKPGENYTTRMQRIRNLVQRSHDIMDEHVNTYANGHGPQHHAYIIMRVRKKKETV